MNFLRSRQWIIGRRVVLIIIVIVVGYRSYGGAVGGWFRDPDPARDIVVTRSEFQPAFGGERPLWFISLRNDSTRTTYKEIVIEATYVDDSGTVTETDRLVVHSRLGPGETREIGSRDAEPREGATTGTLRIIDAEVIH